MYIEKTRRVEVTKESLIREKDAKQESLDTQILELAMKIPQVWDLVKELEDFMETMFKYYHELKKIAGKDARMYIDTDYYEMLLLKDLN